MHTHKTIPSAERPNTERHPGLVDADENPHPVLRSTVRVPVFAAPRPRKFTGRTSGASRPQ